MTWFENLLKVDLPNVKGPRIIFEIPILGGIRITETVVMQWLVMLVLTCFILWLTHDLKKNNISKRQVIAETIVKFFNGMVKENMGPKNMAFAPYIAALFCLILFGALISMTGLRNANADINVTMSFAILTFALITFYKFKNKGFLGYFKGYAEPVAFITPINIISEFATPVSMGFRLFGNMAGGMIITSLLYYALAAASNGLGLTFPIFAIGIPAVLSIYFDIFTGVIQSYVFIMLTMAFVGDAAQAD